MCLLDTWFRSWCPPCSTFQRGTGAAWRWGSQSLAGKCTLHRSWCTLSSEQCCRCHRGRSPGTGLRRCIGGQQGTANTQDGKWTRGRGWGRRINSTNRVGKKKGGVKERKQRRKEKRSDWGDANARTRTRKRTHARTHAHAHSQCTQCCMLCCSSHQDMARVHSLCWGRRSPHHSLYTTAGSRANNSPVHM